MGVFSKIDAELKCGDGDESTVAAFQVEQSQTERTSSVSAPQVRFDDEDLQKAEAEAAPQEMEKLMEAASPEGQADPEAQHEDDADQAKKAHEEAEAKRKAEWEAKQAAKKAEEEEQLRKVAAMGEEELLSASAQRINAETERLTRRNMKEYVAEHLQTLCLDDLAFARLTMHPRKSFMHCIWFINRKAREYLEQEMKDNGMQRPYGVNGMYGGDVPDDLVYAWAEEYYRDPDAEEDKDPDAEFVPKPYTGPSGSKAKKAARKKAPEKEKVEKPAKPEAPAKEPEDENQITFGTFLDETAKAS